MRVTIQHLVLFHFRLYIFEQVVIEEINDCDPQPVAELLDRRNSCAIVAATDDVVHSGLRDAADRAQLVNSQIALGT